VFADVLDVVDTPVVDEITTVGVVAEGALAPTETVPLGVVPMAVGWAAVVPAVAWVAGAVVDVTTGVVAVVCVAPVVDLDTAPLVGGTVGAETPALGA